MVPEDDDDRIVRFLKVKDVELTTSACETALHSTNTLSLHGNERTP